MKLAFSTLGCPDWDIQTVIDNAVAYGFDGVEIRGIGDTLDVTTLPEFTTSRQETARWFRDAGIVVACFSSSVMMTGLSKKDFDKALSELKRYAELCETFQTRYIRIFGGTKGTRSWEEAIEEACANLNRMILIVKDTPARIVVETHDDWMAGEHFRRVMEDVNSPFAGVLWDVNHPYMFIGESPQRTWQEISPWVWHTHWKDSIPRQEYEHGFAPCLMGEGVLPHGEILELLKRRHYDGYLSLEWEKRWHAEIPEPEVAFPQYIKYMKRLLDG